MRLFDLALKSMDKSNSYGPEGFLSYTKKVERYNVRTADFISIQSFNSLSPELKKNNVMVFRLGSTNGKQDGTSFALAKCKDGWNDYFFIDKHIFSNINEISIPCDNDSLEIFKIISKISEKALINFAISSGIIFEALNLDNKSKFINCITTQGTYTFDVSPNTEFNIIWSHINGQVEIDGIFLAYRNGIKNLFVIESKISSKFDSLSKHKIVYPMLALKSSIKLNIPIIGIYLRIIKNNNLLKFCIAECNTTNQIDISALKVTSAKIYTTNI